MSARHNALPQRDAPQQQPLCALARLVAREAEGVQREAAAAASARGARVSARLTCTWRRRRRPRPQATTPQGRSRAPPWPAARAHPATSCRPQAPPAHARTAGRTTSVDSTVHSEATVMTDYSPRGWSQSSRRDGPATPVREDAHSVSGAAHAPVCPASGTTAASRSRSPRARRNGWPGQTPCSCSHLSHHCAAHVVTARGIRRDGNARAQHASPTHHTRSQ